MLLRVVRAKEEQMQALIGQARAEVERAQQDLEEKKQQQQQQQAKPQRPGEQPLVDQIAEQIVDIDDFAIERSVARV